MIAKYLGNDDELWSEYNYMLIPGIPGPNMAFRGGLIPPP